MSLVLGIVAASGGVTSDFEPISTVVTTSGSATSVTFSNLGTYASTYKHLQLRYLASSNTGLGDMAIRFNNDSGANYTHRNMYAKGGNSGLVGARATGQTGISVGVFPYSMYGVAIVDIMDAFSSTKTANLKSQFGCATGTASSSRAGYYAGSWGSTDALTSITVYAVNGGSMTTNSQFTLYGIKG